MVSVPGRRLAEGSVKTLAYVPGKNLEEDLVMTPVALPSRALVLG